MNVGVIGPADLVPRVVGLGAGVANASLRPLPYHHEADTPALLRESAPTLDAYLFTGIVPYTIAATANLLDRPAAHVPYDGSTLLRAIVELLRLGHDVSRMSIDTLRREEVTETLTEARLPTDQIQVLPYAPGLGSNEIVAFHRRARDELDSRVALTCLGSAYAVLDGETHAVRLVPSRQSIRTSLRTIVLSAAGRHSEDAQVVIGLLDLSAPDEDLAEEVIALGGSLAVLDDGLRLIVTTRGPLESFTLGLTRMPLLDRLARRHTHARVAFGAGRTAAEAEAFARRALTRARAVGDHAAVVTIGESIDIVIGVDDETGDGVDSSDTDDVSRLGRRVGLTGTTLTRLRTLGGESSVTTKQVAEHLGVQQRTARRILKRLERGGLADPMGRVSTSPTGRPSVLYRLRL